MSMLRRICVLAVAAMVGALPVAAPAQTYPAGDSGGQKGAGPAGNTHPEKHQLSDDAGATYPFGSVPTSSPFTTESKIAFSRAVDLSPLAGVAVFHDGRVKILGTLAAESVASIVGRTKYVDYLNDTMTDIGKTTGYDPVFTFFDLMIDPAYYRERALIHVEFLPLRELLVDAAYRDPAEREWWKHVGRVSPAVLDTQVQGILARHDLNEGFRRGLSQVGNGYELAMNGWRNLDVLAPDRANAPWRHLSSAASTAQGESISRAVNELASAWRAADAPRVNAAAKTLAEQLPLVNPAFYPTTQRTLERLYNGTKPFEYGLWLYLVSLLSLLLSFGTGRSWLGTVGVVALFGAVLMHGGGFIARCIIAERFAIQNQFESMTGVSLFAALVGLGLMIFRRQRLFAAASAGVGFLVLITATKTGIPGAQIGREAAILNTSVLLKYHVTTVLVSYGLISLGFITSLFYLVTHYATRARLSAGAAPAGAVLAGAGAGDGGGAVEVSASALGLDDDAPKGPRRVLADLDRAQMIILQLAFWALGVGILLGAWWADHSWGRFWGWDPKEIFALITWIVFLIVIHARFTSIRNKALLTAWLSVVGFIVMLWCYFGVNLLLPGMHAYA